MRYNENNAIWKYWIVSKWQKKVFQTASSLCACICSIIHNFCLEWKYQIACTAFQSFMTNSQKATTFNFMLLQFPVHRGQQGILATTIKRKHYFAAIDVFNSLSLHFLHKNVCENSIILIFCPTGEIPCYPLSLKHCKRHNNGPESWVPLPVL